MPITAATFIVGWLAIAGVPPLAGFWSKDEILPFSLAKSPALYAIGLFTALLTAYYMTRQVILVFFGKARWEDHAEEHGAHGEFKPHESPPVMLIPLVVLAGLSIIGGLIQLPHVRGCRRLDGQARAVVGAGRRVRRGQHQRHVGRRPHDDPHADRHRRCRHRHRRRLPRVRASAGSRPMEPKILLNGWYYDRTVSDFMGGPGRGFQDTAWFDQKVIDGAVNGAATWCAGPAASCARRERLRAHYAGIIGVGVVPLLAWFVVVRGMI